MMMMIAGYILYKEQDSVTLQQLSSHTHRDEKHAHIDDVCASTRKNAKRAQQVNRLRSQ